MRSTNVIFSILLPCSALAISGCSFFTPPPKIVEKPVYLNRPAPVLPQVQPIEQQPLQWIIITEDNFEAVVKEFEAQNKRLVFFAMTPEGYETLIMNMAEMRRYIVQQKSIIGAYKTYAETPPDKPKEEEAATTETAKPFWKIW